MKTASQTKTDLAAALEWYPFGNDEPHSGDRNLSDNLVVCRRPAECQLCGGRCAPGTITRVRVDIYAGQLHRYRWCQTCVLAMADDMATGYAREAIQKRFAIGDRRRAARRAPIPPTAED